MKFFRVPKTPPWIGLLLLGLFCSTQANPPAWWLNGNPPIITGGESNNLGVANIGQAKFVARKALEKLQTVDLASAQAVAAQLVGPGKAISSWEPPSTPEEKAAQYAPLMVGQLKAIAAPFYNVLHSAAPTWLESELISNLTKDASDPANYFPWTSNTEDDQNKAVATIGQLKAVFSLRFESYLEFDSDGDGMPDWWEVAHQLDPSDPIDAQGDQDGDGASNLNEYITSIEENDPNSVDSDVDGWLDTSEEASTGNTSKKDHPLLNLSVWVH